MCPQVKKEIARLDKRIDEGGGGGGGTPLAGNTYDFSLNSEIVRALADTVRALGGTVDNDPTDASS